MRSFIDWWFRRSVWGRFFTWIVVGITVTGGILVYLTRDAMTKEDTTCLAYMVDEKLDWAAITKGEGNRLIAERQAERVAAIMKVNRERAGMTLCPQSWTRWLAWARWKYFLGSKDSSPRWQLVFLGAQRVMRGEEHVPWKPSDEFDYEVQSTNSPRNWPLWWRNRRNEVEERIGNLTVYRKPRKTAASQ